jgi:hypothetical protein
LAPAFASVRLASSFARSAANTAAISERVCVADGSDPAVLVETLAASCRRLDGLIHAQTSGHLLLTQRWQKLLIKRIIDFHKDM